MFARLIRSGLFASISRTLMLTACLAAATSQSAQADTPIAVGSARNENNSPWGKLEIYQGGTKLGFFMRIIYNGNSSVMTVMPDDILPDNRIRCKFINYDVPNAPGGDVTEVSNWIEDGGGELILDAITLDMSDLPGQMAYTYEGTQNMPRRQIENPKWSIVRLTTP